MSNAAAKTFTMPNLTSSELGKPLTLVKLGAGRLTLQLATGQAISDSSMAGSIYAAQAVETYATLTLMAVTTTKLVILGFDGTWITT
jgi:hypothetical protein